MVLEKTNKRTLKHRNICYATIASVSIEVRRPTWSVMIPTYNRTTYLEQALRSVLEQDPGPDEMQIEVIDNCSTAVDMEAFVRKIAGSRVSFYRQAKNVGVIANFNTCIQRTRGHLVHILHDDDVVVSGFYSHLQAAFEEEPTIGAAFCRYANIDEKNRYQFLPKLERATPGIISNWIERIAVKQLIEPPAMVVKRNVYEELGGFCLGLSYTIDWEMWKRIAAHHPVWYEPRVLAKYRIHPSSGTSALVKSGENIIDMRKAIEVSRSYLPKETVEKLSKQAVEDCAILALKHACWAMNGGDMAAAIVQIQQALKCSRSLKVIGATALLPILSVVSRLRRYFFSKAIRQL